MTRHITAPTIAAGFVLVALLARAYTVGEMATLWLMALSWAGGAISGVLVALAVIRED